VLKYEPDNTERLFLSLHSCFGGDLQEVLDDLLPLLEKGRTFKEAYELIVNTHGFERSFEWRFKRRHKVEGMLLTLALADNTLAI